MCIHWSIFIHSTQSNIRVNCHRPFSIPHSIQFLNCLINFNIVYTENRKIPYNYIETNTHTISNTCDKTFHEKISSFCLKKIVGRCLRDIKTRNSKIIGQSHEQTRQEDKLQSVYSIQIINKKTEQRAHKLQQISDKSQVLLS